MNEGKTRTKRYGNLIVRHAKIGDKWEMRLYKRTKLVSRKIEKD